MGLTFDYGKNYTSYGINWLFKFIIRINLDRSVEFMSDKWIIRIGIATSFVLIYVISRMVF